MSGSPTNVRRSARRSEMFDYEREYRRLRRNYLLRLGFAYFLYLMGAVLIALLMWGGICLWIAVAS